MEALLALLFMGVGLWTFISPRGSFEFKAKMIKNWGVNMSATPRSYKIMRYLGLAVAIVGFLLYFG